jgi:hypothetical protein
MDQLRRKLVLASPVALGLALTGCGGGGDSGDASAQNAASAAATTAIASTNSGTIKVTTTDLAFAAASKLGGATLTPNATITQACRNGNKLHLCITETIPVWPATSMTDDSISRTVILTLDLGTAAPPGAGQTLTLKSAQIASGALLVNQLKRGTARYDYKLASSTAASVVLADYVVTTTGQGLGIARTAGTIKVTLNNVPFAVTTGLVANSNSATKPATLTGKLTLNVTEETADWIA